MPSPLRMRSCPRCHALFTTDAEFCALDGERITESRTDPLVGATLDRYTLLERLGHGGMSAVYRARHEGLDLEYALKIPYGEILTDRELAERLRREVRAMAKIDHPNVVKVVDFCTTGAGLTFVVMELLEGTSLTQAIREDKKLAPERAAYLLRQIAQGLGAAHKSGFIHRDLKPSNVMLIGPKGDELVKLLDFGLVRVTERDPGSDTLQDRLTRSGMTMGTPQYMAPEQVQGREVTPRADLYSLGAVLYEMLSGEPPYAGSFPEIVVQQATGDPQPLPSAGGLEKLALRLLEHDPEKRPASTDELVQLIDRLPVAPKQRRRRKEASGASRWAVRLFWAAVITVAIAIGLSILR